LAAEVFHEKITIICTLSRKYFCYFRFSSSRSASGGQDLEKRMRRHSRRSDPLGQK